MLPPVRPFASRRPDGLLLRLPNDARHRLAKALYIARRAARTFRVRLATKRRQTPPLQGSRPEAEGDAERAGRRVPAASPCRPCPHVGQRLALPRVAIDSNDGLTAELPVLAVGPRRRPSGRLTCRPSWHTVTLIVPRVAYVATPIPRHSLVRALDISVRNVAALGVMRPYTLR